jgi:hypothetical protein
MGLMLLLYRTEEPALGDDKTLNNLSSPSTESLRIDYRCAEKPGR